MATIFTFLVFVILAIILIARPHLILGPALSMYCFEQWAISNSSYFRSHSTMINMLYGALVLISLAALLIKGRSPFRNLPASYLVYATMFLLVTTSIIWSIEPELSLMLWQYQLPYVLTFGFLSTLSIQSEDELNESLRFSLWCGTITMLLLAFGTRVHAWGRTIELAEVIVDRQGRASNRMNPLTVGELGGQMLILVMLMNFSAKEVLWRAGRWGIALLAVYLTIRSGSRGQLIGGLFATVWFIGASRGYKKHFQILVGVFVFVALLGLSIWSVALTSATEAGDRWSLDEMQESFANTRTQMCLIVLDAWVKGGPFRWVMGLGSNAAYAPNLVGEYPHVLVVEMLTETGFIGLSLLLTYWVLVVADLRVMWTSVANDKRRRGFVAAATGLLLFQVILTFKQGTFLSHTYLPLVSTAIGRAVIDLRQKTSWAESYQRRKQLLLKLLRLHQLRAAQTQDALPNSI